MRLSQHILPVLSTSDHYFHTTVQHTAFKKLTKNIIRSPWLIFVPTGMLLPPHDKPPSSRSLFITREILDMKQPSHLCIVTTKHWHRPRHTEEETNWQSQKITTPTSVCFTSCANTNSFGWETTSYGTHKFLLELWGVSWRLSWHSSE